MSNDAHILELIPAYVLGSLEEKDAYQVSEHLAGCSICRRELDAYQTVADQVLLIVPPVSPPARLKTRLMERIPPRQAKRRPVARGWRMPGGISTVGVLSGLLLILIVAFTALLWKDSVDRLVVSGPLGMRAIVLQNATTASLASGFVVMGADGKNGVLVVDKLPALDKVHEYQVWLKRDSKKTSGGVFSVDEDGYRGLRLTAPESLLNYSSVEVTVEPAGGSAQPTGLQVLSGSLFNP